MDCKNAARRCKTQVRFPAADRCRPRLVHFEFFIGASKTRSKGAARPKGGESKKIVHKFTAADFSWLRIVPIMVGLMSGILSLIREFLLFQLPSRAQEATLF
jgi:hypothetical protein